MNNVRSFSADRDASPRISAGQQPATRIFLLGKTQAIGPKGDSLLPKTKKTKALFAYLCLARGELLSRVAIADVIWDRSGQEQALDSLRHALSDLNGIDAGWRLERERHAVRLDTTGCWIDAFETPDNPEHLLQDVHGISAGFDQWLYGERARYETRWQAVQERKLEQLSTELAPPTKRVGAARELLAVVPTHEGALRQLMKAFVEMDERAEAIRAFERYRLFADANGFPISERTVALYQGIRTAPAVRSSTQVPDGVPQQSPAMPRRLEPKSPADYAGSIVATRLYEPSIAVLPFRNLSGVTSRDYVMEGLTEDLIETLSRVPGLFVVSRLSATIFNKQQRTPQEIGTALGVRYLLSGSMRIIDSRVRLVVELAETDTGRGLWHERLDGQASDLLELQSGLAEAAVHAVAPQLRAAEMQRLRIKRPQDYTAYDFFLRAQENMHSASRPVFESAERLFDEAIQRDPTYATALAWRAYWHIMRIGQGWSPSRMQDSLQANTFAERAVECDPREAMAFAVRGHAAAYLHKDFGEAFGCFEKALEINPNSARAWLWNASARGWTCQGPRAVESIKRAIALSPYDPLACAYTASASLAYLADGQYDRSIEFAMRSIRENRSYTAAYKLLIPALVLSGREAEARGLANQLLMLEPELTVDKFKRRFPGGGTDIGDCCCEALAIAGVPVSA